MSRTQQKALLARDAPYWSGNNTPNSSAPNGAQPTPGGSGYYNPNQPSTALHAPLPLPPPPATQLLSLTTNASQPQQYHQQPSQSAKMARTASGGTNSYPASAASPAPGDQARQQGMQKWAYGLVREAERIERQYRAVEKWRDPLGESLERVMKARKERASATLGGAGKAGVNWVATAQIGAAVVAAKGEFLSYSARHSRADSLLLSQPSTLSNGPTQTSSMYIMSYFARLAASNHRAARAEEQRQTVFHCATLVLLFDRSSLAVGLRENLPTHREGTSFSPRSRFGCLASALISALRSSLTAVCGRGPSESLTVLYLHTDDREPDFCTTRVAIRARPSLERLDWPGRIRLEGAR